MKTRYIITVLAILLASHALVSQDTLRQASRQKYAIGFSTGHYGFDPGVGVEFILPELLHENFGVRAKANLNWLETYKALQDHWANYSKIVTTIVYNTHVIDRARVTIEGGPFVILPSEKFSEKTYAVGFTALSGLEMYIVQRNRFQLCYYFSGGFDFIRTRADKLENKPRYGNGFVFFNGFRMYW